jgi:hypothetical protein
MTDTATRSDEGHELVAEVGNEAEWDVWMFTSDRGAVRVVVAYTMRCVSGLGYTSAL